MVVLPPGSALDILPPGWARRNEHYLSILQSSNAKRDNFQHVVVQNDHAFRSTVIDDSSERLNDLATVLLASVDTKENICKTPLEEYLHRA
jgi:hypothetical protein